MPLAFHVVRVDGKPVVGADFLAERVARTNQIYAPYGVAFEAVAGRPLAAAHAAIETREDRDALAPHVASGVINCFVVRSLRDVDDPTQMRRGVHWHARTSDGAHYVILSSIAGLNVLAHELGHFLGNPRHSDVAGNLMSYRAGEGLPVLDTAQVRRVERAIRGYLRRGELHLVRDGPSPPAFEPVRVGGKRQMGSRRLLAR